VHARVGYSQAAHEIAGTQLNKKVSYTTSGVAYGVGAQYAVTPNLNVFVDYYVLGGNVSGIADVVGNADFSGFNIGLGYKY
jgi:opacity protein-like surface antigen